MEKKISYAIRNIQHFYHASMQPQFYVARMVWIPGYNSWEEQTWNIDSNTIGM